MKPWAGLTDEQRHDVLILLNSHADGDAREAAHHALLLAACSPALRIVSSNTPRETGTYSDSGLDAALRAREVKLRGGLFILRTFHCQHDPPCSEVNRGGCCNSCWARSWAEEIKLP